ncbi:cytoplasmic protein [Bdellovibrio bacteriovorus]|uniref:Cytoplasmic protein n=1 Tax=Bdellovibrio bacteriovorus TaxID=959 RepID=A0A150WDC1_BDEBC|nr:winged helix DNA-binding domain-containing protein [Bdellovibrio bacteriovorus]KYG60986.1 cytoplasmic protein [Bdellovibrio bacteriovorus]
MSKTITKENARGIWLKSQGLTESAPFGKGSAATTKAIEHLGYVQIDTINVIERCHHHILYTRIPDYKRRDLHQAQSQDKTVFEYWTHALSYVPTQDFRFFIPDMKRRRLSPGPWLGKVKPQELQKVLRLIKKEGPISIRDITDDVLVEKDHEWASRKPSKKALQLGFYSGRLVISERQGMLKKYELLERHFAWDKMPKPATRAEVLEYEIQRSLRAQGLVTLDSICHLVPSKKPEIRKIIEKKVKKGELIEIKVQDATRSEFWVAPEVLDEAVTVNEELVHILSPFDPLTIQRKRLHSLFDYEHRFEAYVPKEKRKYGYFALPVLVGDKIVAAIDLKTDREKQKMLIQKWTWLGKHKSANNKKLIESELNRFEKFQLQK